MDETKLTFVLGKDGLQASTLCLDPALGLYYVPGEAPLAQGGYRSVFKCFLSTADGLKPCALKMVPLSVGDTLAVDAEFHRLCAVLHIPGTVKVLQQPIYTATHGFLVTEYVALCCQEAELYVAKCMLNGSMTCRFIPGNSLAKCLLRAAFTAGTQAIMRLNLRWRKELLQALCLVSIC